MSKYILGELNKDKNSYDLKNWEEVPGEDLWEDGELRLDSEEIKNRIYTNVVATGEWKLIRRKND
tara:strand:- start:1391 stop:1585 length:195 start_codon:yes stop_codon:yes gene_type:complete